MWPRQESNLDLELRKLLYYPRPTGVSRAGSHQTIHPFHRPSHNTPNPKLKTQNSELKGPAEFLSVDEQDSLLPEAIKLVKQHQRASASLLQRRLRIGYSKAAQLIELLEQQGVVGPAEDGRSREVLKGEED